MKLTISLIWTSLIKGKQAVPHH